MTASSLRWVLLALALSLTGCLAGCWPNATLPILKTEYVVVAPTEQQVQDCEFPEPPDVQLYLAATLKQREGLLTGQVNEGLDEIAKCNARWKSLRDWIATQKQIYSDKKK